MASDRTLADTLRAWLLGQLHVGLVRPGESIPSIREIARSHDVDHRAAARAYAQLQDEGLVEVRGRSGVFAAPAPSSRAAVLQGRRAWLADVLGEAWLRQVSFAELSDLMRRCTRHGLRCACIDGTEDHAVAIAAEAAWGFGLETVVHRFASFADGTPEAAALAGIEDVMVASDFVITTVFHAHAIAPVAERVGRACVAVAVNPALRDSIRARLGQPLTVVVADPGYANRARLYFGDLENVGTLQLLVADDVDASTLAGRDDVLITRAARRRLGLEETHLTSQAITFIAPESAHAIGSAIISIVLNEDMA